jgi:death-on-curing protein
VAFQNLAVSEVLLLHDIIISRYGGATGLRDRGLLEGALGRAETRLAYSEVDPESIDGFVDAAVAVAHGIVTSHPFVDGNKRTAFQVIRSLLRLNGVSFAPPIGEEADAMVSLASGTWTEAVFLRWVRGCCTLE